MLNPRIYSFQENSRNGLWFSGLPGPICLALLLLYKLGCNILIFFPVHQQQLCDEHLFKITFVYTVRVVEQHLKYPNQESILQVFHQHLKVLNQLYTLQRWLHQCFKQHYISLSQCFLVNIKGIKNYFLLLKSHKSGFVENTLLKTVIYKLTTECFWIIRYL